MNDFTSTISGIIQKIGDAFLLVYYLPSVLFIAIQLYLFVPAWTGVTPTFFGVTLQTTGTPTVDLPALIQLLAIPVLIAVVLAALSSTLIRLYSGKVWWLERGLLRWRTKRLRQRVHEQYAELDLDRSAYREYVTRLLNRVEVGKTADTLEKIVAQIEAQHQHMEEAQAKGRLPTKPSANILQLASDDASHTARLQRTAPTAFGACFTAVTNYTVDHYRIDTGLFWSRLQVLLTKEAPELTESLLDSENQMTLCLNLSFLSAVLMVEGVITWLMNTALREPAVTAIVGAISFFVFYRASVGGASRLAQLMMMAFDQHRHLILRMFNLTPAINLDEEHRQWESLTQFIVRAEPFYFPPQGLAPSSQDSEQV